MPTAVRVTIEHRAGIPAAQEWAFNLEGMPQFDYVFVIIEENESQSSVVGSSSAPLHQ